MGIKTTTSNSRIGKAFESLIDVSARNAVRLERLPQIGGHYVGHGNFVRDKICCDYVGTVRGTGRAIFFDAKSCHARSRFPVGNPDHVPDHQRRFLIDHGQVGAIAGLLVEASEPDVAMVFWCRWQLLAMPDLPAIDWSDERIVPLGDNQSPIDFHKIIRAA